MRQRAVWLLFISLLGALTFGWYQHNRIVRMETQLGEYWSNEFSMSYFSQLGDMAQRLDRLGQGGTVNADDREYLNRLVPNMELTLTNTLDDVRGFLMDLPEPRFLGGYLHDVDLSVRQIPLEATGAPLPSEQQQDFRRHTKLASEFLAIVQKHYEDFRPDGGFTQSQEYWGRNFLSDKRWRAALAEMDSQAQMANYPPRH